MAVRQSAELLGEEFYKHIGLNEWADGNNIIVLYPQAHSVSSKRFHHKKHDGSVRDQSRGMLELVRLQL